MKNVICVLLMCAFAAPVMSQRVKQDRKHGRKHVEAVHKKADVKKGCPKCNSLKKELEALKKRDCSFSEWVPREEVVLLEVVVPEAVEGREAPLLESQMTPRRRWNQQERSGLKL